MARREEVCKSGEAEVGGGRWRNESFDQEQLQGKVNNEEVEQMKSYPLICSASGEKKILTFR